MVAAIAGAVLLAALVAGVLWTCRLRCECRAITSREYSRAFGTLTQDEDHG